MAVEDYRNFGSLIAGKGLIGCIKTLLDWLKPQRRKPGFLLYTTRCHNNYLSLSVPGRRVCLGNFASRLCQVVNIIFGATERADR